MFFKRLHTPELSINTYIIGDETSKIGVVIDPPRNPTACIMAAESAEIRIVAILETHVHADFVSGALELKSQLKGKPVIYASGMGGKGRTPAYADNLVQDRQQVKIGALCIEAWHTPGHTPEHIMWVVYDLERDPSLPCLAFSGDSVFVGSIGRPDLLGNDQFERLAESLFQTIHVTLAALPDSLEIFPGHGAGSICGKKLGGLESTTLGYERKSNDYFLCQDKLKWPFLLKEGLPAIPPYCEQVKSLNLMGPPLLTTLKSETLQNVNQLEKLFLLDIRQPEAFASFHFEGALNIPFTASFCKWAGWFVSNENPIGIVADHPGGLAEVIQCLRLMGFDQPIFSFVINEETERASAHPESISYMSPQELSLRMHDEKEAILVLDVRSHSEWAKGHIADAMHLDLCELNQGLHGLPQDRLIAVICRTGLRASTAASLLRKYGFSKVANVKGGVEEWKAMSLPLI